MSRNPFSFLGWVLSWVLGPVTHRPGAWIVGLAVPFGLPSSVWAQPQSAPAPALAPARPSDELWQPTASSEGIALESSPGFSLGLGAYGGLALLMTRDANRPHALAGVLSRARYGYAELGAVIELTDAAPDEWRSVGGFVGAWLPYRNWVDFELAAGFAVRRYLSSDPRYGAAGYEVQSPALTLRLGVSDRSSEALFGARIGAEILAAWDLRRRDAGWQYQTGPDADPVTLSGATRVSGFSIGLALSTGFDVGFRRRVSSTARPGVASASLR